MQDTSFLDLQDTWEVFSMEYDHAGMVSKQKFKNSKNTQGPNACPLKLLQKSHGLTPLTYVVQDNTASIALFNGLGFESTHEASWLLNNRDQ